MIQGERSDCTRYNKVPVACVTSSLHESAEVHIVAEAGGIWGMRLIPKRVALLANPKWSGAERE